MNENVRYKAKKEVSTYHSRIMYRLLVGNQSRVTLDQLFSPSSHQSLFPKRSFQLSYTLTTMSRLKTPRTLSWKANMINTEAQSKCCRSPAEGALDRK